MFRRTAARRTSVLATSIPPFTTYATDMAFFFPRFQPQTHIQTMGIPELADALPLLQHPIPDHIRYAVQAAEVEKQLSGHPSQAQVSAAAAVTPFITGWTSLYLTPAQLQEREKGLLLLERGVEILEGAGGHANHTVYNLLRPLYATRFALLNGVEHLPRPSYGKHVHVQKKIMRESAKLLFFNDNWEKSDVKQIDTSCVILAHFIKAFCALHPRPFNIPPTSRKGTSSSSSSSSTKGVKKSGSSSSKSSAAGAAPAPKDWRLPVGDAPTEALTLALVMERLEELQRLCAEACKVHGAAHPELRWHVPKLQLLKGLLTIPLTGNLVHAQQHLQKAAHTVHQFRARQSLLLEGLKPREREVELGLFNLAEAELTARMFNWDLVAPGEVDAAALRGFDDAALFYAAPFDTAINADGIADPAALRDREMEVLAYNCCLTAAGSFLLNAPRPPATNPRDGPVFLPKQLFQMDPLLAVSTSSDMIFSTVEEPEALSVAAGRRRAGEALERALQLNRGLLPELRHNAPAAATLQAMACLYADTRDYLYATGLFETANKTVTEVFGATSLEQVHLQKLRYEFLAGVGSEEEAKAASHEVVHLLKKLDQMPC